MKSYSDSNQWRQASRRLFGGDGKHLQRCMDEAVKLCDGKQSRTYICIKNDPDSKLDDVARTFTLFGEIEGIPRQIVYFKNPQ